ncbi:MAG: hypothetical protein ACO3UY_06965 [Opitutales bacterium]
MDFGEENENAISKGPFYGAAAFIFLILVLFASVGLQENGTLYHWEIATCLLGTGLISILLFLPHFLQKIVDQLNDNGSQAHSELTQKAIFEVKELRSDLDSIALKIDKVPTLVDQIVRESINSTSDPSERIVDQIQAIQQELNTKLDRLEETSLASPLPPETDPKIESLYTKTEELYELLQKALSKLATIEQAQLTESRSLPKNTNTDKVAVSPSSLDELIPEPEVPLDPSKSEIPEDFLEEKQKVPQDDESTYELSDSEDFSESDLPDEVDLLSEETKDDILDRDSSSSRIEESIDEPEDSTPELEDQDEVSVVETELDLGLPDPAETLRKVDALLAGEDPSPNDQPAVTKEDKTEKNGTTTVVANVMIGIGNKPYLRGEGPGLSWDEGVAMNFIEIGKWAWSPPRKNASLTVQVYRNDQDPDQGGKVEIRPGEKIEITPEFS